MIPLTDKTKILINPRKKSAKDLLKDLKDKNYNVSIKNRGAIIVTIDKKNVPMSLGPVKSITSFSIKNI